MCGLSYNCRDTARRVRLIRATNMFVKVLLVAYKVNGVARKARNIQAAVG